MGYLDKLKPVGTSTQSNMPATLSYKDKLQPVSHETVTREKTGLAKTAGAFNTVFGGGKIGGGRGGGGGAARAERGGGGGGGTALGAPPPSEGGDRITNVTLNIGVMPGNESEAGRVLRGYIDAYERESGHRRL